MTHPGGDLNRRWLGLVLVAMTAVLIMLLGAGTALAATAPEVEAVGDGHHTEGQSVLGWHDGRPTCNSGLATGVVAENSLVESARIALTNRYDGAEPIYDTSVLFVDARTVVQVEPVGRPSAVPLGMQVRTASEGSVSVSGFGVAAKAEAPLIKAAVHGNSRLSPKTTYLYRLSDDAGNYLKTGVTSNPGSRYSQGFLVDKRLDFLTSGSRSNMLNLERFIVERDPGPLNFERWAGRFVGDVP